MYIQRFNGSIQASGFLKLMRPAAFSLVLFITLLLSVIPAQSATVTGTFRFLDYLDPAGSQPRPIAFVKVEIWHKGIFIWNTWANAGETETDGNGWMSFTDGRGDGTYAVRVFATNYAVVVWPDDTLHTVPFHREPGMPGPAYNYRVYSVNDVLDFSYDFTDEWAAKHFNIADAVRHGFDYANARRDPGETDTITQANYQPTDVTIAPVTYYNPVLDEVVLSNNDVWEDRLLLHEYAHALAARISSFGYMLGISHNGCQATDMLGNVVNEPWHAWMEGFADYFAGVVELFAPANALRGTPGSGTLSIGQLENSLEGYVGCAGTLPYSGDAIESYVASSLWDLFDRYTFMDPNLTDPGSVNEPRDLVDRLDTVVFQIFDKELDNYGVWPDIWQFRNAWSGRGQEPLFLDHILSRYHIIVPPLPENGADFWVMDYPNPALAGEARWARVVMINTGITTWEVNGPFKLGSQNPPDNLTWGLNRVAPPQRTGPAESVDFWFIITAPPAQGAYNFQWRMIDESSGWFGEYSLNSVINVYTAPDLIIRSISANPATPAYGENVTLTVTVRNQGSAGAGAFFVDLYKDRTGAPAANEFGDQSCRINGLAAGAETICTGIVSYPTEGVYSMWAQVDTDQDVSESYENNNIFGPQAIDVTCPPATYYRDYDGDGYGNPWNWTQVRCESLIGYVTNDTDCNDYDANQRPGQTWYQDADGDGISTGNTLAQCPRPAGHKLFSELNAVTGDCNDNNPTIYPDAPEICDSLDNNCDGSADNSPVVVRFDDVSSATMINTNYTGQGVEFSCVSCASGAAYAMQTLLAGSSPNGVSLHDWTSAFAAEEGAVKAQFSTLQGQVSIDARSVEAMEIVGTHHEKPFLQAFDSSGNYLETVYYPYERGNSGWGTWQTLTINRASNDIKYVLFSSRNNLIEHPGGVSRGVGGIYGEFDNLRSTINFTDIDGDGYYSQAGACGLADCNDDNGLVNPGAVEVCNGVDDNCNGSVDEGVQNAYYKDSDGDGYGNPDISKNACVTPDGYVADNTDCNDKYASINPGALEVCSNELDDNCNRVVDETRIWYLDGDEDGYGDPGKTTEACEQPAGYVTDKNDCNDSDKDIHPGAAEVCDGKDNDCDGAVDKGPDSDADKVGDACDNCSLTTNPGQQDTNGDGYGNRCDCDLDNNNFVGPSDFNIFKAAWLSDPSKPNWNADADFDSNNFVGPSDFNIFKTRWLKSGPWK